MADFRPIGHVESEFKCKDDLKVFCKEGLKADMKSRLVLSPEFTEGLAGLEKFSHAFVIYHLHETDRIELSTFPGSPELEGAARVGLFASRSPYRPNHIGLRLVRILGIDGNAIRIQPPLELTKDQIDKSYQVLDKAFALVEKSL